MAAAIEVQGLEKTFRGKREVQALAGISFSVPQGRIFGLLGPNGSGKTTAVRILTTILRADAGVARVLGYDVAASPHAVRRVIGLAGQYAAVDENLTGRENLRMVGRLNHLPSAESSSRTRSLLEQFDLADAADRTLKTYSGGMRRRLDLAAALVARPPVLFLDEPTTGLDPQSRNDLWEVIEHLVEEGTTVLLTTQYLEEADRLASTLVVLDHGRVIAEGTPAELKANLGATVLAVGFVDGQQAARAAGLMDGVGDHEPLVNGVMVEVTVDDGPAAAMESLRLLDREGLAPTTFALRDPSLDDVFLALTGHRTEGDEPREGAEEEPPGRRNGRSGTHQLVESDGGRRP